MNNDYFVNPYCFIPLSNKGIKKEKYDEYYNNKDEKYLTGWLDITIQNMNELIISDTSHKEIEDSKYFTYDFLKVNGKPIIPGSQIRGLIRKTYEIVTNSCFPRLKDNDRLSIRNLVSTAYKDIGLLTYDKDIKKWYLYSTVESDFKKFIEVNNEDEYKKKTINIRTGHMVTSNNDDAYVYDAENQSEIYALFNKPISFANTYYIRIIDNSNGNITKREPIKEWTDNVPYDDLKMALERIGVEGNQEDKNDRCHGDYLNRLKKIKNEGGSIPVYYLALKDSDNQYKVFLSSSSIGRIAMDKKWEDLIPNHHPCTLTEEHKELCPACLLFGSIGNQDTGNEQAKKSIKTKVRFTDAICEKPNDNCYKYHDLQVLSSPKPTSFEFYLKKPNNDAKNWNFDYYVTNDSDNAILYNATISGRKMYWHWPNLTVASDNKDDEDKKRGRTSRRQSLSANNTFKSRVYFDGITKSQLEILKWCLTLGENRIDGKYLHKIGLAKPLGYGSIKICIDKLNIRSITNDDYNIETIENADINVSKPKSGDCDILLQVCDKYAIDDDYQIDYPRIKENGEIYEWFAKNRDNNSEYIRKLVGFDGVNEFALPRNVNKIDGKVNKKNILITKKTKPSINNIKIINSNAKNDNLFETLEIGYIFNTKLKKGKREGNNKVYSIKEKGNDVVVKVKVGKNNYDNRDVKIKIDSKDAVNENTYFGIII